MQIKPLKRYNVPSYPTREQAENRELPVKDVCKKWNSKMMASSVAIMSLTVLLSGCVIDQAGPEVATGGVVPPPYELTEEEALKIIFDEAKKQGIELQSNKLTINDFRVVTDPKVLKELYPNYNFNNDELIKGLEQFNHFKYDFEVDGYDPSKKIGIEYIKPYEGDSAAKVDLEELAGKYSLTNLVNYSLKQNEPDKIIQVFGNDYKTTTREEAEKALKEQLHEFFEHLREQGIIE